MSNQIKYLYGASVQGIQNFIFQTDDLKDIVGASELVEQICTEAFKPFEQDGRPIVEAAGNIKFIFNSREACERAVLNFPRKVMSMASGVTISQAVVQFEEKNFQQAVFTLEEKLKVQRNAPMSSLSIGWTGVLRSRKTGLPAVKYDGKDILDLATLQKRSFLKDAHMHLAEKSFGQQNLQGRIAYNIGDLVQKNNWIAVVHADGNGLGNIVRTIGSEPDVLRAFSGALDQATCRSAQIAFKVFADEENKKIPLRPVVLGGDDMTAIIRGDKALAYTVAYLRAFEEQTREKLGEVCQRFPDLRPEQKEVLMQGLTACAGIAFVKVNYPFHYAYQLAEILCGVAKKDAKSIDSDHPQSCLKFHKVQDSFIESYREIAARELTPCPNFSFDFGPYYLNPEQATVPAGRWSVDELMRSTGILNRAEEKMGVRTGLRQWMTLLNDGGMEVARQKRERMLSLIFDRETKEWVRNITDGTCSPVYDLLSLYTILSQIIQNE